MSYDAILGLVLSILLPLILDKAANVKRVKLHLIARVTIIFSTSFLIISINNIVEAIGNEDFLNSYYQVTGNNLFQAFIIVILVLLSIYFYTKKQQGICNFEQLSKIICDFTKQVSDNDILYIFCGDMDIWGNPDGGVMSLKESTEFKQLLRLQEENKNIDIRILCKHCMENDLIEEILDGEYDVDGILNETRLDPIQVKRIAYFKKELRNCSFRFYRDGKDDYSNLRARVIVSHGTKKVLVYHKEMKQTSRVFEKIRIVLQKLSRKNERQQSLAIFTNIKNRLLGLSDSIYEYNELASDNNYELLHYVELCDLKWNTCDGSLARKIEEYCINYYEIANGKKTLLKKIAFVYAKTYEVAHYGKARKEFPPFGVMYLAAMVKKYCPEWIPSIIAIEENNIEIEANLYDIIAFSVISAYTVPIFEKCMNNIDRQSKAICIAGGYQAELEAQEWVKKKMVRLVLCGEGENTIVKLLNGEYQNKAFYKNIEGAIYLYNRELTENPKAKDCIDLDKIPFPARDLLPEEDYIMNNRLADTSLKMVHVMFSRGCSYKCAYCGAPRDGNKIVRYRSPQNIVDELENLKNKGIEGFSIIDDCFLTDKKKALSIIKEVKKVNLKWSLAARIDQINKEILEALREAGCLEIKFGIETGSDTILEKMNKGFNIETTKKIINLVKEYDIGVKAFIITGLPGETEETNKETERFLEEMGTEKIDRISLLRFVPLPGSHIYQNPEEYGIRKDIRDKNKIDYKNYKLYNGDTNWWIDNEEYERRNKIYNHIREFMLNKWSKI